LHAHHLDLWRVYCRFFGWRRRQLRRCSKGACDRPAAPQRGEIAPPHHSLPPPARGGRRPKSRAPPPHINSSAEHPSHCSHLGNAGIGASLILFATRGPGDADRADYLVTDLDRHAATHRNHVRDLLQKSVLRLISEILELKRGLAASASRISFEATKFHGV